MPWISSPSLLGFKGSHREAEGDEVRPSGIDHDHRGSPDSGSPPEVITQHGGGLGRIRPEDEDHLCLFKFRKGLDSAAARPVSPPNGSTPVFRKVRSRCPHCWSRARPGPFSERGSFLRSCTWRNPKRRCSAARTWPLMDRSLFATRSRASSQAVLVKPVLFSDQQGLSVFQTRSGSRGQSGRGRTGSNDSPYRRGERD